MHFYSKWITRGQRAVTSLLVEFKARHFFQTRAASGASKNLIHHPLHESLVLFEFGKIEKKLHNSHALKNTHFDERSELSYFTLKNKNCKLFSNTVPLVFMYCVKTLVLLSSLKRQRFTGSGCCKIFGRSQIAVAKACQSV